MKYHFHYDSDLIGGSLQVRESRVIADLLLRNVSEDQWKQEILQDNRLQKRTRATARRIAQALRKRLERLDPPFWRALRDGDDELATQVAFCAALERNLLLVEFVETVVQDAFLTRASQLQTWQWGEFLDERTHRDPLIALWTDSSRNKMGQVVFRMLAEVGLIQSTRTMQLHNILVRPEVRVLLVDSSRQRLLACLDISVPVTK